MKLFWECGIPGEDENIPWYKLPWYHWKWGTWFTFYSDPPKKQEFDFFAVDDGTEALLKAFVLAIKPEIILETGTRQGKSTRALLQGLVENKKGILYTVDKDDYGMMDNLSDDQKERVVQIVGKTPEVYADEPLYSVRGFEMAFLDGAHDKEGLEKDIEYIDAHRDGECLVMIDNACDNGWPEIYEMFQEYKDYPHIFLKTKHGLEIIHMR